MKRVGIIKDEISYILAEHAKSYYNPNDNTLSLYIEYVNDEEDNEDEYNKIMTVIDDGLEEKLKETLDWMYMSTGKRWKSAYDNDIYSVVLEDVYIMDEEKDHYTLEDVKNARMTKVTVPIKIIPH